MKCFIKNWLVLWVSQTLMFFNVRHRTSVIDSVLICQKIVCICTSVYHRFMMVRDTCLCMNPEVNVDSVWHRVLRNFDHAWDQVYDKNIIFGKALILIRNLHMTTATLPAVQTKLAKPCLLWILVAMSHIIISMTISTLVFSWQNENYKNVPLWMRKFY